MKKLSLGIVLLSSWVASSEACQVELKNIATGRVLAGPFQDLQCMDALRQCNAFQVRYHANKPRVECLITKVGGGFPFPQPPVVIVDPTPPYYPPNPPYYPPAPPVQVAGYVTADCHIDDDTSFDLSQSVLYSVRGRSALEISEQCDAEATRRHGGFGTSLLLNIRHFNDRTAPGVEEAECHLDNDLNFDQGQYVIGEIRGQGLNEIYAKCKEIGSKAFGAFVSAGLRKVNFNTTPKFGMQKFECHIDDDFNFDYGQFTPGYVIAPNIWQANIECDALAKLEYGSFGSGQVR